MKKSGFVAFLVVSLAVITSSTIASSIGIRDTKIERGGFLAIEARIDTANIISVDIRIQVSGEDVEELKKVVVEKTSATSGWMVYANYIEGSREIRICMANAYPLTQGRYDLVHLSLGSFVGQLSFKISFAQANEQPLKVFSTNARIKVYIPMSSMWYKKSVLPVLRGWRLFLWQR